MNVSNTSEIEQALSATLIPNQRIIELMSIIALKFFPEKERKLSRYQDMLERFFLENFPHSVGEYIHTFSDNAVEHIVLLDAEGNITSDFLCIIMAWMNIASKYKNEFHKQLRLCLQEQTSDHPIVMTHGKISLMDGQIIFSPPYLKWFRKMGLEEDPLR